MVSPEEQIQEEIKKAQAWYGNKYQKTFEAHQRYDKEEKHFSWRLIARIGDDDRMLAFGISEASMENPKKFAAILARLGDHIRSSFTKAQVKWEPHILARK